MSTLIKRIIYNRSTRIMFYFYVAIIGISAFFLIFNYTSSVHLIKAQRTERLKAIASVLAVTMDGDQHDFLLKTYPTKDAIKQVDERAIYQRMQRQMERVQQINNIKTPIYTLKYNKESNQFFYCVRSDEKVYYMHQYKQFPKQLVSQMNTGGTLPVYETENGIWISAFFPIRNRKGEVSALLEVDEEFGQFKAIVNTAFLNYLWISLTAILVITLLLIPVVRRILKRDEQVLNELNQQKKHIENINKDITSSVNYASTIQHAMLPEESELDTYFTDHFVYFKPRDVVSGDFYWSRKIGNYLYFAVADCTGHGIPGAMMSMIGSTSLSSIVKSNPTINTGELLDQLDSEIHHLISNKSTEKSKTDGMDIAVIRIDTTTRTAQFSGALNDLIRVSTQNELTELNADRFPIGGASLYKKHNFSTQEFQLEKGERLYLFSDGFQDQFGGPKGKKYRIKQMKLFIKSLHQESLRIQYQHFDSEFKRWKHDQQQIDDVLVMGVEV